MRAHRGGEDFGSRILEGEADVERRAGDLVCEDEAEGEGVDRAGFGVVREREAAGGFFPRQPGEAAVAGEAVLCQMIRLAVMAEQVVLEAADDGEEVGRVPRPGGAGLPEEFPARGVAERAELGPHCEDARGERAGADLEFFHLCHQRPPSTCRIWPLTKEARSEAKKSTALAMSVALPRRLSAMRSMSAFCPSGP